MGSQSNGVSYRDSLEFAWKLNSGRRNPLTTTAVVPFVMLIRTILIPNLDCFDGERNALIIHQSMLYELLSSLIAWFTPTMLSLHITPIYLSWGIQAAHIAFIYSLIYLDLFVNDLRSTRLQFSRLMQLSFHASSEDAAYEEFIKLQ